MPSLTFCVVPHDGTSKNYNEDVIENVLEGAFPAAPAGQYEKVHTDAGESKRLWKGRFGKYAAPKGSLGRSGQYHQARSKAWSTAGMTIYMTWGTQYMGARGQAGDHAGAKAGQKAFAKYVQTDVSKKPWIKQSALHAARISENGCECSSGYGEGLHTCYARCCGIERAAWLRNSSQTVKLKISAQQAADQEKESDAKQKAKQMVTRVTSETNNGTSSDAAIRSTAEDWEDRDKEASLKAQSKAERDYNARRLELLQVKQRTNEASAKRSEYAPEGKKYANSFDIDRISNDRIVVDELYCNEHSMLGADKCCDKHSEKIIYGTQQSRPTVPWCVENSEAGDAKDDISPWVHSLASTLQDGMWHNHGRMTFTGDFNGDNAPDTGALIWLSATLVKVQVIYSGSESIVTTKELVSSGLASIVKQRNSRIVTGDFNADGKADIVVMGLGHREAFTLFSNGDGTWKVAFDPSRGLHHTTKLVIEPRSKITVTDVNNDKNDDIIVFGNGPARLAMSYGNGKWAETALFDYLRKDQKQETISKRLLQRENVFIHDVNADGKKDFALFRPGSKATPFLFGQCDQALHPKAPKHSCSGWLAGPNVHKACIGKRSCTLKPDRKTWGNECAAASSLKLSVLIECSDPDPGPKKFEIMNTKVNAVSIPHTILLEVKPPKGESEHATRDLSVPVSPGTDKYETLAGYSISFRTDGPTLLAMSFVGKLVSPTEGEADWQFYVDGVSAQPRNQAH